MFMKWGISGAHLGFFKHRERKINNYKSYIGENILMTRTYKIKYSYCR